MGYRECAQLSGMSAGNSQRCRCFYVPNDCCRERNDGCYTALTYLSAKIIEEALVALVQSIIFACIVFFPCEFSGSFALFWYTYFQTTLIGIREPLPPHSQDMAIYRDTYVYTHMWV